jgi:predicted DNA-binding antitoxin AbrB/MazE fold protein
MSTMIVNATYDHGVFRPDLPQTLGLRNRQKVQMIVQPADQIDAMLDLAAEVYAGLDEDEITAIEHLILRNEDFYRSTTDMRPGPP